MSNLFQQLTGKFKNSRIMVSIFFLAVAAVLIGLWLFAEDTYSSRIGLEELETALGLKPVNWQFTYIVLSIAPQVGQLIFGYAFASKQKWWLGALALGFFALDFTADLQDRSAGLLIETIQSGAWDANGIALMWASVLTFGFYTVGSEMFIVIGSGIILETFDNAIDQTIELWANVRASFIKAKGRIQAARDEADSGRNARNHNRNMARGRHD